MDEEYTLDSQCGDCIRNEVARKVEYWEEWCDQTAAQWEDTNRNLFRNGDPSLDFDWHVPTRCFVDPGFRSLDPFQDDKKKQLRMAASGSTVTREVEREVAPDELDDEPMDDQDDETEAVDERPTVEQQRPISIRLRCNPPSTEEQKPRISVKLRCNPPSTEQQEIPSSEEQKPRIRIKLNCKPRPSEEQQTPATKAKKPRISIKLRCNRPAPIAPCCVRQQRHGPIGAYRPEDAEERYNGRINGDNCTAQF